MGGKAIPRWLGLVLGTLAMVLGLSGALLAFDPLQQAWQAPATADDLPVAALVQRVQQTIPRIEEVRRLPSGVVVVYSFEGDQARAVRVDPADGTILGPYQASALPRWVKNLHRTLLAGDTGAGARPSRRWPCWCSAARAWRCCCGAWAAGAAWAPACAARWRSACTW